MGIFKVGVLAASISTIMLSQVYASVVSISADELALRFKNIARNTPASMSSVCEIGTSHPIAGVISTAAFEGVHGPLNVIDGDLSPESRWSSSESGASVTLDLGSSTIIEGISTAWFKADIREAFFEVQISQDGSSFATVIADGSVTGTEALESFEFEQQEARYVRIVGMGNSVSDWTSLIEAQVFSCSDEGPVNPTEECERNDNLQIVRATSVDDFNSSYGPANAIDGDLSTESRWSSNGVGNSLILDLGELSTVTEISAAFYKGDERDAFFDVRTSADESTWTTVLSQGVAAGTQSLTTFDVDDSSARYVEIIGLGNSVSNWNSLLEVDIHGCGNVDDTEGPEIPVVSDVNVVFNGTFENNLSGWTQVEPAQGSSDAYEGVGAGKILSSGAISQSIFVIPQSRYSVTAYLQGDPTLGITVNGDTITAEGPDNGSSYEEVSFEFDSGNATTAEVFVRASSSPDTARVDNIEVVQISGGDGSTPIDPNTVFDFSIWEVEGETPITREGTLSFDSLDQCVITPNGNGCRHEMKVIQAERYGLTEQFERFKANIVADLSECADTIVAQHHPEATGTLTALYLSDRQDPYRLRETPFPWMGLENNIACDGIYDVVLTVRVPGSTFSQGFPLGTVQSGEFFDFEVINDHGVITATAFGNTVEVVSADSSLSYFKFGNYMQAIDPFSDIRLPTEKPLDDSDRDTFLNYYSGLGIDRSVVEFRDIEYSRTID